MTTLPPGAAPVAAADALSLLASDWTVLHSAPADGARNMAVDLALLREAQATGRATLRLYTWTRPTLSLGRHERAVGRFSDARLRDAGVDLVRRPTGGRALLHGPELTYSIAAPNGGAALRWRYDCINALLSDALRMLGVTATSFRAAKHSRPGSSFCFSEPSSGELTVDGAKLAASAQLEEPTAFLQHGSLLLRDAQSSIAGLLEEPAAGENRTRASALEDLLQRPIPPGELADALVEALRNAVGAARVTSAPSTESLFAEATLSPLVEHFRDPAWTWSR